MGGPRRAGPAARTPGHAGRRPLALEQLARRALILVCPDKFAGTLTRGRGGRGDRRGLARGRRPATSWSLRPLSDGGPGFVDVVRGRRSAATADPVRRRRPAGRRVAAGTGSRCVRAPDDRVRRTSRAPRPAACTCCSPDRARPRRATTSYGWVCCSPPRSRRAPAGRGRARRSATNDGGAGLLAALGAAPVDAAADALPYGGAALGGAADLGLAPARRGCAASDLVAATDVDNPLSGLHGARRVRPAEGRRPRRRSLLLDAALGASPTCWSGTCPAAPAGTCRGRARRRRGRRARRGAARARRPTRVPASALVRAASIGLDAVLDAADLVITGEGTFDCQSLRGKVVAGVAGGARDRACPAWCWPGGSRSAGGSGRGRGVERRPPLRRTASRLRPGWRQPRAARPDLAALRRDLARQSAVVAVPSRSGAGGAHGSPGRARPGRARRTVGLAIGPDGAPWSPECSRVAGRSRHGTRRPGGMRRDCRDHIDRDHRADPPASDGIVLTDAAADKVKALLEQEGRDDLRAARRRAAGRLLRPALPAVLRRAVARRRRRHRVRRRRGRGRPDERAVPRAPRSTSSTASRSRASRSTTRTRSGSCACGDSFH